jgi:hypothetical protein
VVGLVREVRAAVAEPRELARHAAARQLARLTRERPGRERRGVRALGTRLEWHDQHVEQAEDLDAINRPALLIAALELRPEVERVGQPHGDEGGEHDERRHARRTARHAPPRRGKVRLPVRVPAVRDRDRDEQPHRVIRRQDDRHHSNRTRGSTKV